MIKDFINLKFLGSDFTIAANTTKVDGGTESFNSEQFDLRNAVSAAITLYVKGANSSASGQVTLKFVSYNSALGKWDTNPFKILSVVLNGTNDVVETFVIPADVERIKLYSITNGDTTYSADVNASISIKV